MLLLKAPRATEAGAAKTANTRAERNFMRLPPRTTNELVIVVSRGFGSSPMHSDSSLDFPRILIHIGSREYRAVHQKTLSAVQHASAAFHRSGSSPRPVLRARQVECCRIRALRGASMEVTSRGNRRGRLGSCDCPAAAHPTCTPAIPSRLGGCCRAG